MVDGVQLEEILNDNIHGSTHLAKKLLDLIVTSDPSSQELMDIKKLVLQKFGDMQIMVTIFDQLETTGNIKEEVKTLKLLLQNSTMMIEKQMRSMDLTQQRVLTFSHSQTVKKVIECLGFQSVSCMRSEPGGEGQILAEELKCSLVEDLKGIDLLKNGGVDILIIGADKFTLSGILLNKVGTQYIVDIAEKNLVPVYVLASQMKQTEKITPITHNLLERVVLPANCKIVTEQTIYDIIDQ